jgi:hypothetical protein
MRVMAQSRRVPATARNVIVTVAGRDPMRPKLVVMTPRRSWWQSSSERGGGLVCWLEALRAVLAEKPGCDVVFTANSGAAEGKLSVVSPDKEFRSLVSGALAAAGASGVGLAAKETVPNGETRDIHRAGARYFTLVGTNRLFHLP